MFDFCGLMPQLGIGVALVCLIRLWWVSHQRRLRQEMEGFYEKYPAARGRYKPWV